MWQFENLKMKDSVKTRHTYNTQSTCQLNFDFLRLRSGNTAQLSHSTRQLINSSTNKPIN
jgi:hypothetical protein